MASSILFGGRRINIPGVYTEVDVSGLAEVGLGATGTVAIIGEAQGGSPYNGDTPVYSISNPAQVNRIFADGDIPEAARMAFDPSLDPEVPGGAQQLRIVKVNPSTRSSLTLSNADGPSLEVTSRDYGVDTTRISVDVADGTVRGKAVTITQGDAVEVFDDLGGDPVFTLLYTPGSAGATTMVADLNPSTGFSTSFTKTATGRDADYVGELGGILGLDGDADNAVSAGSTVTVVSGSAADTTQTVTVYGIDNGSSLPTSETLALNGTAPVVGTTQWSAVHGVVMSAPAAGIVVVSDTGDSDQLFDIPIAATTAGVNVFSSVLDAGDAVASLVAGGATTAQVLVIGVAAGGTPTIEAVTLAGATPVSTTTAWESISALALGLVAAATTLTLSGLVFPSAGTLEIVSSDAADTQAGVVYGLDAAGAAQSAPFTLNGTSTVAIAGTWSRILAVTVASAAAGTVSLQASGLAIKAFDITAGETSQGFIPASSLPAEGALTAVLDGAGAQDVLVVGLDANQASLLEKVTCNGTTSVVGTATTWSQVTGFAVGHLAAARTLTLSGNSFDLLTSEANTVGDVSDVVSGIPGFTFIEGSNVRSRLISSMDTVVAGAVLSATVNFTANNAAIVEQLNLSSSIVTATAATGATGAPSNTTTPAFLTGGVEGVTSFADWQAALDLLREQQVNTIVPLTADAAVHAAVAAHCRFMAGDGRRERDAIVGAASGETLAALKARAVALNTRHVRIAHQDIVRFNIQGVREQFPPYFAAVIAAGMQAGTSVGTPLTFKILNVLDVIGNDASYTITDNGSDLIDAGLFSIETAPNIGFRWLRNVTSYLVDNNPAFTEASVNEAVNFTAFNLRTILEAVVGRKGNANTVNAAKGLAIDALNAFTGPNVGALVAWQNLSLTLNGDVPEIDVEIAPVQPVNFVPVRLSLTSATLTA